MMAVRGSGTRRRLLALATLVVGLGGLAWLTGLVPGQAPGSETVATLEPAVADRAAGSADPAGTGAAAEALARTAPAQPADTVETQERGRRILVSLKRRRLWLVDGRDTLFSAAVAIGMGENFTYNGRRYRFETPAGRRTVIGKARDPVWIVPEWHYYEKAAEKGLEAVKLDRDSRHVLGDSSVIEVRGQDVGRTNHFGHFTPVTPGSEIMFDGKLFIPPMHTRQRRVPDALGPYKLDMGDGYLIHGTHVYNEETIGDAVSHGCVRMRNEDLTRLYPMVPRGTTVIIF
ncbi:MAG: L,D-transpeptidase [Gemmatimonadetes bacterium]|nr:L,D-transpeptidase [Gemmatimonadota bacterium]